MTNVRNLDSPFWRIALEQCRAALHRPGDPLLRMDRRARPGDQAQAQGVVRASSGRARRAALFAFAGLWRPGEGGPYMAFLTCEANAMVGAVHPKAMPVMLRAGRRARAGSTSRAKAPAPLRSRSRTPTCGSSRPRDAGSTGSMTMAKTATTKPPRQEKEEEGRRRRRPSKAKAKAKKAKAPRPRKKRRGKSERARRLRGPGQAGRPSAGRRSARRGRDGRGGGDRRAPDGQAQGRDLVEDGQGGRQGRRRGDGQADRANSARSRERREPTPRKKA